MTAAVLLTIYATSLGDLAPGAAIAAIISGSFALVTQRSAARSNRDVEQAKIEGTTRGAIEEQAFIRAQKFYTDTIEGQEQEIAGLREDLQRERQERAAETQQLRDEQAATRRELESVRRDLVAARALIRRLRPVGGLDGDTPDL